MRGGVSADSRSEISSLSQGSDTSGTPTVPAVFMETSALAAIPLSGLMGSSKVLNRSDCCSGLMGTLAQSCGCSGLMGTSRVLFGAVSAAWGRRGLRKASRSGSTVTSELLMDIQSSLRGHSGLMGTSRSGLEGLSTSSLKI